MKFRHKFENVDIGIVILICCTGLGIAFCCSDGGLGYGIPLIIFGIIFPIIRFFYLKNKENQPKETTEVVPPVVDIQKSYCKRYIPQICETLRSYGVVATNDMLIDIAPKITSFMLADDFLRLFDKYVPDDIIDDKAHILEVMNDYRKEIFQLNDTPSHITSFYDKYFNAKYITEELIDELYDTQIETNLGKDGYCKPLSDKFNIKLATLSILITFVESAIECNELSPLDETYIKNVVYDYMDIKMGIKQTNL